MQLQIQWVGFFQVFVLSCDLLWLIPIEFCIKFILVIWQGRNLPVRITLFLFHSAYFIFYWDFCCSHLLKSLILLLGEQKWEKMVCILLHMLAVRITANNTFQASFCVKCFQCIFSSPLKASSTLVTAVILSLSTSHSSWQNGSGFSVNIWHLLTLPLLQFSLTNCGKYVVYTHFFW